MVAAILIIGFASGMTSALAAVFILNTSLLVAALVYVVFGVLGTTVTLLALAVRPSDDVVEELDGMSVSFQPRAIPAQR